MMARETARGTAHRAGAPGAKAHRHFDSVLGMYSVRVLPGECYTTAASDEIVMTVLGSCVAACVRDPVSGYGGMNHFMLPESETGEWSGVSAALRYGNYAMEVLINAVLKTGCPRARLEVKLFGGANFLDGRSKVGEKNAAFATEYLKLEGLEVAAADLGGNQPRVIRYMPATGSARRILLPPPDAGRVIARERRYNAKLSGESPEGDIELFE